MFQNHHKFIGIVLAGIFCGCANNSAYNGGKGSFSEYEDWGSYENTHKRTFEHGNSNTYQSFSENYDDLDAFKSGADANIG